VEISTLPQDWNEDQDDSSWAAAIDADWQDDWSDPREDIYCVADGEPITGLP